MPRLAVSDQVCDKPTPSLSCGYRRFNEHVGDTFEELLVPYRLRAVRIGVQATWLTIAGLVVFLLLAGDDGLSIPPYLTLLAVAGVGAAVISKLPWESLLRRGIGVWVLYAWSAFDILLITLLIGVTGGADSELFIGYFLTTIFFAASYPEGGQLSLLAFTYACYASILWVTGWEISTGDLVIRLTILSVTGFIASFMCRELMAEMSAHRAASDDSARRARLLEHVAASARAMSQLGPEDVLETVVYSVTLLGFDAAAIMHIDAESGTYTVSNAQGLPVEFSRGTYPTSTGLTRDVLAEQKTVTVDDYSNEPHAIPLIRDLGMQGAVAAPLWVGGELRAVMAAGRKDEKPLAPEEVEVIELLAAQASRALENAERFAEERRTVERLAEVDRLKDDFLSMVSHDLRTPLTVIEGSISTLEYNWDRLEEDMRKKLTSVIGSNARHLSDIITKLLDLTRLEAGHFEAQVEPIELAQILKATASRFEELFGEHDLEVDVEEPLVVEADRMLVERVVENLLSNAAKYTPAGTRVELSARTRDHHSVVSVCDEGPGIPEEDLVRLGERFFRGAGATSGQRGTGLGLAWVLEILKVLGSELKIESKVGHGSTFEFELPLVGGSLSS